MYTICYVPFVGGLSHFLISIFSGCILSIVLRGFYKRIGKVLYGSRRRALLQESGNRLHCPVLVVVHLDPVFF